MDLVLSRSFFHPPFQKTLLHLLDLAIANYAIAKISYLTPSVQDPHFRHIDMHACYIKHKEKFTMAYAKNLYITLWV
jgi:hypothetical protein